MKKLFLIFCLVFYSVTVSPQIMEGGLESINAEDLLQTVKILTSAEFDGRLPGSEGYNKAAEYAAERFEQIGLLPAGDENYFQYLNLFNTR